MSGPRLYRPSNGSEGEIFQAQFCDRCERDREWREKMVNPCEIQNAALIFGTREAGFPAEWCYDADDRPTCTAFVLIPEPALAIVGSISLAGHPTALEIIEEALDRFKPLRVVSGGAAGIDTMAKVAAERRGIPVSEHKPKVQKWLKGSPDGFEARNLLIAQDCSRLVRIVAKDSTTYGSGWTRDRARQLGKPTDNFVIDRAPTRDASPVGTDSTRAER